MFGAAADKRCPFAVRRHRQAGSGDGDTVGSRDALAHELLGRGRVGTDEDVEPVFIGDDRRRCG